MLSQKSSRSEVLVAIEGPDYTGKSFIVSELLKILKADNKRVKSAGRPGSLSKCMGFRNLIVGGKMDSTTRQCLAMMEAVKFAAHRPRYYDYFIYDRFNPISGQIYGPPETHAAWRMMVDESIIDVPKILIFVESSVETIKSRVSKRGVSNKMDCVFLDRIDMYLERYESLKNSQWVQERFKVITLINDFEGPLDLSDVVSKIKAA